MRCRQGQSQPQLPGSHASSLPSARTPGQCLLPPTQPSQRTGHLGCPGSPRSLPTFSVTHPLQRKTNTSAHIEDRNGRSIPWERGRGGCFSHASSQRLALGSLPLGWLWEMALVSLPAPQQEEGRALQPPQTAGHPHPRCGVQVWSPQSFRGIRWSWGGELLQQWRGWRCPIPLHIPSQIPIPLQGWV